MARTKIVATIGPASSKPEIIAKMLNNGMNVARINFSHGSHDDHRQTIKVLREVAAREKKVLAIIGDLQGPKIRLGHVRSDGIQLSEGDLISLTDLEGQPGTIPLPHSDLIRAVRPGAKLIIGDGEVELVVQAKQDNLLRCEVAVAGLLESRRGVNAPGTYLPISSITEKDEEDLALICELDLDYVALSFVRTAADVLALRRLMHKQGKDIPIIAKIEKQEAINNLSRIREVTNGMMVARGDLGIEMAPEEVPMLQKRIIRLCNEVGKPVITATQMLQSMMEHPRPTRAEASDVANAILDGTDAVMLSGETAVGDYPVQTVAMMRQIAEIAEREFPYDRWSKRRQTQDNGAMSIVDAISASSCEVAESVGARVIVCATVSGYTARQITRHRPRIGVMAVSPSEQTRNRLALVWGVDCLHVPGLHQTENIVEETVSAIRQLGLRIGDKLVITASVPLGVSDQTNLIRVYEV